MKAVTLPDSLARRATRIAGLTAEAIAPALVGLCTEKAESVIVVIGKSRKELDAWGEDVPFFLGLAGAEAEIALLPDLPDDEGGEDPRRFELECDRLAALSKLNDHRNGHARKRLILLTTPRGFFSPVPKADVLASREIRLRIGDTQDYQKLIDTLGNELGYENAVVCETPGQFAVRGGLIDVYPTNANAPVRIDFFGDEIDGLRSFDPTTQRTLEKLEAFSIAAFAEEAGQRKPRNILDYFGAQVAWVFVEPKVLADDVPMLFQTFERSKSTQPTFQELFDDREKARDRFLSLSELEDDAGFFPAEATTTLLNSEPMERYRTPTIENALGRDRVEAEEAAREALFEQMREWQQDGHTLVIITQNEGEEERLRETLAEQDGGALEATFLQGPLRRGFRADAPPKGTPFQWPRAGGKSLALVCGNDIFGRYRLRPVGLRTRRMPHRSQVDQLLDFSELAEGDYVVHLAHGICIYRGISQMEIRGKTEEVISLEFDEALTLHLPLHESHLLSRYVGLSKSAPRLGKLGTNSWDKARAAAEKATLDFAASLLKTQASRETGEGHAFAPDTSWQKAFENSFIHEETPDQLRTINETKADMELEQPMDRLICGDVGFGKTEVALRAAFKAVMDGKQVAVLVPTTVLAQQHFNTFRERMAEYPVAIEMLSRFRNKQQQTQIVKQAVAGQIDILVGTHRLISKDVQFKNLGLLIIDEEHRFGVRHKERLKEMRAHVDVITMSATPIPRTLYMALMGARQLSVIETPPVDRLPIQTMVKSYDDKLVQRAIQYELERGGQVFYLHNRVQTIESVAQNLQEMLPKARIGIGHGQMTELQLEKIMTRYVRGDFDVLVCTTIIESGLDIPNCNTIIIEGADRFGLAQLYQLRGRVGRFKRQAYAYLLLHRHARMLDQARKRLGAMRQYNQLGAGFKIAMRDLELRGAGNLLGAQQSGHIASIGFDLYCQLLRQSISRLKGEEKAARIRASVRLDFVVVGEGAEEDRPSKSLGFDVLKEVELEEGRIAPIEAYLPRDYLPETRLRIDFYRRLALAETPQQVEELRQALEDRFGKAPAPVEALFLVHTIRSEAEQAGVVSVETESNRLKCRRASGRRDDYIKVGNRFPRLTARKAILRLQEILTFLRRQEPASS